jgi:hypothetical protein
VFAACVQQPQAQSSAHQPTVSAPPDGAPDLNLVASTDGVVTLAWPAVTGATSYLWWQVSPSPTKPAEVTNTQVTVPGLSPGRRYSFTAVAANVFGWGPVSPLVSVTVAADWNGVMGRADPFVFRVKFGSCDQAGCVTPIALGYTLKLPGSGSQPRCGTSGPPPDATAHWRLLPCWSERSSLFFVTAYHIFCNTSDNLPEFLDARGFVVYWGNAGCAGHYTGPVSRDIAGEFTKRGLGGLTRAADGPMQSDQVLVLGTTPSGQPSPGSATVLAVGVDFQEPPSRGFGGATVHGAIALSGSLAGELPGAPVLNGKGEVLGAFMPAGTGLNSFGGGEATGYILVW